MSVFLDIFESIGGTGGASAIGVIGGIATTAITFIGKRMERRSKEELAKYEARNEAKRESEEAEKEEILSRLSVPRSAIFDALADELDKTRNAGIFEMNHDVRLKSVSTTMIPDVVLMMTDQKAKDAMNHAVFSWYKSNWKISRYDELDTPTLEIAIAEDAVRFRDIFVTRVKKDAGKNEIRNRILDTVFSYEYARTLYDQIVRYSIKEKLQLERELKSIEGKKILG